MHLPRWICALLVSHLCCAAVAQASEPLILPAGGDTPVVLVPATGSATIAQSPVLITTLVATITEVQGQEQPVSILLTLAPDHPNLGQASGASASVPSSPTMATVQLGRDTGGLFGRVPCQLDAATCLTVADTLDAAVDALTHQQAYNDHPTGPLIVSLALVRVDLPETDTDPKPGHTEEAEDKTIEDSANSGEPAAGPITAAGTATTAATPSDSPSLHAWAIHLRDPRRGFIDLATRVDWNLSPEAASKLALVLRSAAPRLVAMRTFVDGGGH